MLIHQYSSDTGEYIASRLADINPKNPAEWLIPAFSTVDPLPERKPKTWPFRRGNKWVMLPDYRGLMLYRQDTGEPAELMTAGLTPEAQGLTEAPRPSPDHVWVDGEWLADPARIAERERAAAMAEFTSRLERARAINHGKADAYAAGMLTRKEAYSFLAWSSYQLDLVRAIEAKGFPQSVKWPDDPAPYESACGAMLAEYDARMASVRPYLDANAEAFKSGKLDPVDEANYREYAKYAAALDRTVDAHLLDGKPEWPDEPMQIVRPPEPSQSSDDSA
ncbi:tail fiber assembly protein [Burkholderia sp. AU45388]|uniref:tail fiber assembly protein n=1 Tax=Burkholderia sp. AU45388 TaxID=3059206 RepID=UPI00265235C1|nr:tail fiber assembly protein [Burkholderia sp. AU45388]MDN7430516.1 tail fiber assembly protein [Burkholderia sp. AU45388]